MNFFRQNVGSPHAGKFAAPNDRTGEHWVTIGAVDGEGGTPVQLDKDGTIVKGPRNLTGAPVSDIGRKGQAAEHRKAADLLGEQEGKPGQARSENKSENKVASIGSVDSIESAGKRDAKSGGSETGGGGKMEISADDMKILAERKKAEFLTATKNADVRDFRSEIKSLPTKQGIRLATRLVVADAKILRAEPVYQDNDGNKLTASQIFESLAAMNSGDLGDGRRMWLRDGDYFVVTPDSIGFVGDMVKINSAVQKLLSEAQRENNQKKSLASVGSVDSIESAGKRDAKSGGSETSGSGKMEGTIKQQAWANQIKDKIKATIQRDLDDKGTDPRMVATLTKNREWLETTMEKINDPKFWIDLEMTTKPAGVVASPIKLDWQALMKEIRQKDVQQKFGITMPSKT